MTKDTVIVIEHLDPESGNSWVEIHCPNAETKEVVTAALHGQTQSATSEPLKLYYVFMTAAYAKATLEARGLLVQINEDVYA